MKLILILSLVICPNLAFCQNMTDTIYFDGLNRRCFPDETRMTHYRVLDSKNMNKVKVVEYTKNHILIMTGFYESKNMEFANGDFIYYYPSGNIKITGEFVKNKKNGIHNLYYDLPGNSLHLTQIYQKDKLDGKVTGYFPDGKTKRIEIFKNGKLINGNCYTYSGLDTSYYSFYKEPMFPGGDEGLLKYIKENVIYPKREKEIGAIGTVIVSFEVSETGLVENIIVIKEDPSATGFTKEVLRVLNLMPRWEPAMQDLNPVKYSTTLPITFSISYKNPKLSLKDPNNLNHYVYIGYPKY